MNKLIPISVGALLAAFSVPAFAQVPPSTYRKQEREKAEAGRDAKPQPPVLPPRRVEGERSTSERAADERAAREERATGRQTGDEQMEKPAARKTKKAVKKTKKKAVKAREQSTDDR
ncbi:MAG: hypothetical protein JSR82_05130 [Verrucomicrobia bacterium]|nr:hypothetical protein [Verrucomicrobiota bacterium]